MSHRLGIDIGGTFTDAILVDDATGSMRVRKIPSTPASPSDAFLSVVDQFASECDLEPSEVTVLVHGTTVATNAIIEGKVARTGFITTAGFRDMLEIARQTRPSLYDLQFEKPRPIVDRYRCFGVPERLDHLGTVVLALDEAELRRVASELEAMEVDSIAVCYLHSYVNPTHEVRTAEILRELLPGKPVSLSSQVAPEFREYLRASTTVINAAIQPTVGLGLERVRRGLSARGFSCELLVMQSSGGVTPFSAAEERPVTIVESGPAAGVMAAAHLGQKLSCPNLVSLDMGGTTAKAGLVLNGSPQVTKEYEVGASAHSGAGGMRGRGYPIRTPVVDLVEIGAGGGSIAWVDSGGALRVGPQSAGAEPGPACYAKGGQEPTVTDANLVLGRIAPGFFLGGEMELDAGAARAAIESRCCGPLGLTLVEAAYGIIQIANSAMANALRLVSVQRGHDPRELTLLSFGGAGPLHANWLARELSFQQVVVPTSPGTFSAMGLLVTDLTHEYSRSLLTGLDGINPDEVAGGLSDLASDGAAQLRAEGVGPERIELRCSVDLRYVGQSYELNIPLPEGRFDARSAAALRSSFHDAHLQAYGFCAAEEPIEMVNVRVVAVGLLRRPPDLGWRGQTGSSHVALRDARKEARPVCLRPSQGFVDCPVWDRYLLPEGAAADGPSIIEENDSTTLILPGSRATVDGLGNVIICHGNSAASASAL